MHSNSELSLMANAIRFLSIDAVEKANSGHQGLPVGFADVATVLFSEFLKFDAQNPKWENRDRFVLSAGHGSMLLYSLLYLTGYKDCTLNEIKNFRQMGAKTAGHPEYGYLSGIETTTGPLGQGVANAVGMAIAEKHKKSYFGKDIIDHKIYCVAGDGCLMEGISYEALGIAGHLKLNNLVILWDNNEITIDGRTDIARREDMKMRMESIGFQYLECDGHDYQSIRDGLSKCQNINSPVFLACKTTIGKGSPVENTSKAHGASIKGDESKATRESLNWEYAPFETPENILNIWRDDGKRCDSIFSSWQEELNKSEFKEDISKIGKGLLPDNWSEKYKAKIKEKILEKPNQATRKSSNICLEVLTEIIPGMIGGSADLTGSNLTKTASTGEFLSSENYAGRYINYGVREHAMAGIMNGLALDGGIIPYAGTFLSFVDYQKPSIRLSSIMEQQVIYVLTHDSIGVGEDGPTHQPVEQIASLRATPNLNVFRPGDLKETADCYEIAIRERRTPSAMILSRQNVNFISENLNVNNCERGAYIIYDVKSPEIVIFSSGTEVELAINVAKQVGNARVVSCPCLEIFDKQSDEYKKSLVANAKLRIAIEAGCEQGWHRYIGNNGLFFGVNEFGASAPANEVYEKFGLTVNNIVENINKNK